MADIVVYGGGLSGCSAAAKAAGNAPSKSVVLIVPDPVATLGGISTAGGQNIFDVRWLPDGSFAQKGTFGYWYNTVGQFYNTANLASIISGNLALHTNLTVMYMYDVENFQYATSPYRMTALNIRNVFRDTDGYVKWGSTTNTITGSVFIDASEEGRLLRLFNSQAMTVGRYDWPSSYLDSDEKTGNKVARQQVATLMFQMTGIDSHAAGDWSLRTDTITGALGGGGGVTEYSSNAQVLAFNNYNGPYGYAIKPFNLAQNGPNSTIWWINTFLIFNVDGRAYYRDQGTWRFPANMRSDYITVDQAWVNARSFLANNADLIRNTLRVFPGFANADFVYNGSYPVVGDVLYIRETAHAVTDMSITANGTENSNYQLTTSETIGAGTSPSDGSDIANYPSRIGLGFYQADINAYKFGDLKDTNGTYIWDPAKENKLRPDLGFNNIPTPPSNPVYIPYQALLTNYVANLLIPGYAAGCSSIAWSEMRVMPNLCVLGDAAGVAAAYCANNSKYALGLNSADISAIQSTLISSSVNARLDK